MLKNKSMKTLILLLSLIVLILNTSGCSLISQFSPPTATPTEIPATSTPLPSPTPVPPTATPEPTKTATPTAITLPRWQLFMMEVIPSASLTSTSAATLTDQTDRHPGRKKLLPEQLIKKHGLLLSPSQPSLAPWFWPSTSPFQAV